eukprot:gene35629-43214_t
MLRTVASRIFSASALRTSTSTFNFINKAGMFSVAAPTLLQRFPAVKINQHLMNPIREMASKKHKKVLKRAKGFRGRASRCFTVAFHRVQKAKQYAYRDRKVKKRDMRSLWIMRMNAACRMYSMPYSHLISGMAKTSIALNRKVLSELAVQEPLSFKSVVEVVKQAK